jgi:GAF domain-containing protein
MTGSLPDASVPRRPRDEAARQHALDGTGLIADGPSPEFDDIVALLAMICDVPIALISLIDRERQWFKAKVGLDVAETGRDVSFCGHAIMSRDVLVVPDATLDPRFAANPLVTGAPHIRFYAGVPLTLENGHVIGTLCAIDTRPRPYDDRMRDALSKLSRIALLHIEDIARRAAKERS